MQINGFSVGRSGGGLNRLPSPARNVEKCSGSGHLGTGAQDTPNRRDDKPARLQVELVCQDETQRFDPFWDGPRLKPVFVAQLLGQVMPGTRVAAVQNAYGKAAPRMARLVDRTD